MGWDGCRRFHRRLNTTHPPNRTPNREVGLDIYSPPSGLRVRIFLNRLLGMPLPKQACLLEHFLSLLRRRVAAARADGTYDEGIRELKGFRVSLGGEPQALDLEYPSDETPRALVQDLVVDRGVAWERAQALLAAGEGEAAAQDAARRAAEAEAEGEEKEGEEGEEEKGGGALSRAERRRRKRRRREREAEAAVVLGEVVGFYRSKLKESYMLVTPKPRAAGAGALVRGMGWVLRGS